MNTSPYIIDSALKQKNLAVTNFIKSNQSKIKSILPFALSSENVCKLDLSKHNKELAALSVHNTEMLRQFIFNCISSNEKKVGIGGYDEDRGWYQRAEHFEENGEPRTIHIGVDLWTVGNTEIFAPLDGEIHSFQNNALYGDYGPTIILKHLTDKGDEFFTLYGHLSEKSLEGKSVGQKILANDAFCTIGTAPTNGNWPEHLHFQIILDMLGKTGDFAGVCTASDREYFLTLCPDANLLLALR